ncbi:cyclodeaminase/cyclohydrolase family protein [Nocardioides panacisoli]|uniref:Cyclodeaminase/cyclohydrolase domain-containing protein n=1 Tax=Nocardioides panacisoli TaxID=627624 RepID=A0ABP7HZB4_9ACTN
MAHDDDVDGGELTDFLNRLAARTPTPAGGSVAALCTAQAAALVAMVARYCDTEELAERAEGLVDEAQRLMADDERAFGAVAAAWKLPRGSEHDADRRAAINDALLAASEPQARLVETAVDVLVLIDQLRHAAAPRPGLASDLVAAAEVARTASAIARMNVESNVRTLPDSEERERLLRRMGVMKGRA